MVKVIYDANCAMKRKIRRTCTAILVAVAGIVKPVLSLVRITHFSGDVMSIDKGDVFLKLLLVFASSVFLLGFLKLKPNEIKYFNKTNRKKIVYHHFTMSNKFVFGVVDRNNKLEEFYIGGWTLVKTSVLEETIVDINHGIVYIPKVKAD